MEDNKSSLYDINPHQKTHCSSDNINSHMSVVIQLQNVTLTQAEMQTIKWFFTYEKRNNKNNHFFVIYNNVYLLLYSILKH